MISFFFFFFFGGGGCSGFKELWILVCMSVFPLLGPQPVAQNPQPQTLNPKP